MKKIGIIGIGKLGLCFALNMERSGKYNVIGVDLSQSYVDSINNKSLKSDEPDVENYLIDSKNFVATTEISQALISDIIFIIVPTPSSRSGTYDQSYIDKVLSDIIKLGPSPSKKLIVVQSTTTPGYCREAHDRVFPFNYDLIYNPEFIAQGSIIKDQQNPDVVLIGTTSEALIAPVINVYNDIIAKGCRVHVMSHTEAEITKIALNCFVTTKIAFANMVGDLALRMNCDGDKILKAIGEDSRIGSKYLKYGFGYGGPCFPRDNRAFGTVCERNNIYPHIPYATDKSNQSHLINQVAEFTKKHPQSETVILTDLAYKKGCPIITESQQLEFAVRLAELGYDVTLSDTPATIDNIKKIYGDLFTYQEI